MGMMGHWTIQNRHKSQSLLSARPTPKINVHAQSPAPAFTHPTKKEIMQLATRARTYTVFCLIPINDRDVTDDRHRVQEYASFAARRILHHASIVVFLFNALENTEVAPVTTSVFLRNTR